MNVIIQKILFVLAGASLALGGFMIWSPGTFGFCDEPKTYTIPSTSYFFIKQIELCPSTSLVPVLYFASPMMRVGLAILAVSILALFLPARFYPRFRNAFLVVVGIAVLILYLIPDIPVFMDTAFDIVWRTNLAWRFVLLGGFFSLLYTLWHQYWRKAHTPRTE